MAAQEPHVAGVAKAPSGAVFGWALFIAAIAAFWWFLLSHQVMGVQGDPQLANPAFAGGSTPPKEDTSYIGAMIQTAAMFAVVLWLSWRRRRLHWSAIIAIGALFTAFIDPFGNWATFAVMKPEIPHAPRDWPYFSVSPSVQPVGSYLGGYSSYYFVIALFSYFLFNQLIFRRVGEESWIRRHPLISIYVGVYLISLPFNTFIQAMWIRSQIVFYPLAVGPIWRVGDVQIPVLVMLYDPFIYGMMAMLCYTGGTGRSVVLSGLAKALPGGDKPRDSAPRQIVVAAVLIFLSALVPVTTLSILRSTLPARPAYDVNPFPQMKVYDPYGDLQRAGKPGPFFR
jgi:hypothetical protein